MIIVSYTLINVLLKWFSFFSFLKPRSLSQREIICKAAYERQAKVKLLCWNGGKSQRVAHSRAPLPPVVAPAALLAS